MTRLYNANLKLERLRYLIRLSHDLQLINNKKYGAISEKINTIGGTVGNWIKSLKNPKQNKLEKESENNNENTQESFSENLHI